MKYVPEENENRCPNCGGLYRVDNDETDGNRGTANHSEGNIDIDCDAIRDKADWRYDNTYEDEASEGGMRGGIRISSSYPLYLDVKREVISKFISILAFVLIIFIGVVGCIQLNDIKDRYDYAKEKSEELLEITDIRTENLYIGGDIEYKSASEGDLTIHIEGLEKRAAELTLPEGYELFEISYTIEENDSSASMNYIDENGQEYFYDINITPYVVTKGGTYIEPISYDYEELLGISSDDCYDRGISYKFSFSNGKLYYILREDDFDKLALYCEKTKNYTVTGIEKIIYLGDE
jgi:hypothetical protein